MRMINQNFYNKILQNMPVLCVDAVIISQKGVLFLKRKNSPALNEWWFPGGRVFKNEKIEDTLFRKIKEEVNIKPRLLRFLGFTQTIFDDGMFGIQTHTVNLTYLLICEDFNHIKIDANHDDYLWTFDYEKLNLNSEILELLKNNKIDDKCLI